ncbi:hypothetical protein CYMTET_17472 [Cymbomonas tetramitiformis]|uniref:RING-type domain-containing protein n=1 Tax=Cymbomonas tetramitiformis TaxID=36881 RepID=A0AAE0GBG1_9CHLO|nr:hypothetical protein CYMTET_17472 [Cymbomonas tetramitiformis]
MNGFSDYSRVVDPDLSHLDPMAQGTLADLLELQHVTKACSMQKDRSQIMLGPMKRRDHQNSPVARSVHALHSYVSSCIDDTNKERQTWDPTVTPQRRPRTPQPPGLAVSGDRQSHANFKEHECAICGHEMNLGIDDIPLIQLSCSTSHVFHKKCIMSRLKQSSECPVCRKDVRQYLPSAWRRCPPADNDKVFLNRLRSSPSDIFKGRNAQLTDITWFDLGLAK